ncbi:MAG TPA: type II CRISPR RNA-guided endonuclease Cas9 [Alphaproteobacteria bacterium]|nr:type II CRISPR RNA-guided endonuclease Cas9 [Alphaproteobacteria bacterium]
MRYRLGLDMGISSLGWAVVEVDTQDHPQRVVAMGVRKFNSGREDKTQAPLAQKRRQKRSMRRQRARFLRRQQKLLNQLGHLGLMPLSPVERRQVADCNHPSFSSLGTKLNPYELRALALSKPLPPYALGRVLFALNQRRGFKSNRKTDAEVDKKFYAGVNKLAQTMKDGGFSTLGAYFAYLQKQGKAVLDSRGQGDAVKEGREGLQTTREMYEAEFDAIQKAQQPNHKFTTEDWAAIKKTIFYQRPLRPVERGKCQLYGPQGVDKPRAYAADPLSQKMRAWQDINNLKIISPGDATRFLTDDERQEVWRLLCNQKSISFTKLCTKLKLPVGTEFNLASAKTEKGLTGLTTDYDLAKPEHFGPRWHTLTPEQQTKVVELLQSTKDEEDVITALVENLDIDETAAEKISALNLEGGTARFCTEALAALLAKVSSVRADAPANRYMSITEALAELGGGYTRPGTLVERLSYYAQMMPEVGMHQNSRTVPEEKKYGVIGNPTVHIALNQLRQLVNAILKEYGHPPAGIVIELARDLKANAEQKREWQIEIKKNLALRDEMLEECRKVGTKVNADSREDFLKYKLWKELPACAYTGEPITLPMLFSNAVHIEHILPRSRSLDDSSANLTLATRDANKMKGAETPYEYYQRIGKPEAYDALLARTAALPHNKRWRFTPDAAKRLADEEDWLSSMLNDTRYMSRLAKRYLEYIAPHVEASPGKITAKARHQWFGKVLEKNRHADHRHHAVDALTLALLTPEAIREAQRAASKDDTHVYKRLVMPCPVEPGKLHQEALALVNAMIVSHRVDHGAQGALHEETAQKHSDVAAMNEAARLNLRKIEHQQGERTHSNYYKHAGVHHIDFWLVKTPSGNKVEGVPVFMHQTRDKPRNRPHPAATLLMRLHNGDCIVVDEKELGIVRMIKPSARALLYAPANEVGIAPSSAKAGVKSNYKTLGWTALLKRNVRKASVDMLGRLRVSSHREI